jgi:hypothetical protein
MNLSDLVPLLRVPLIITSSVAIGLTYGSLSHWSFSWDSHRSTPRGLAITLIISLTTTILFLTKHLYYRFAKQNTTAYHLRKLALYAIAAASDFSLSVALMVLHVLNVIESGKRDHPTILMMYAAFGALVARYFHLPPLTMGQANRETVSSTSSSAYHRCTSASKRGSATGQTALHVISRLIEARFMCLFRRVCMTRSVRSIT